MAFDIEGARKEGYSDAEIANHLAQSRKFDLAGARNEGYSDADIIAHLSSAPGTPSKKDTGVGNDLARTGLGILQGAVADPILGIAKLGVGAAELAGLSSDKAKAAQSFLNKEDELYKQARASLGGEGADVSRISGAILPFLFSGGVSALARFGPGVAKLISRAGASTSGRLGALAERKAADYATQAAELAETKPILSKIYAEKAAKLTGNAAPAAPELVGKATDIASKGADIAQGFQTPISKLIAPTKFGEFLEKSPILKGAVQGAEITGIAPEFDEKAQENYLANKTGMVSAGALVGGVGNKLLSAITPKAGSLGEQLALQGKGTLGQQSQNELIQNLEKAAAEYIPGSGRLIKNAQEKAVLKLKNEVIDPGYAKLYDSAKLEATPKTNDFIDKLRQDASETAKQLNPINQQESTVLSNIADTIEQSIGKHSAEGITVAGNALEAGQQVGLSGRQLQLLSKAIDKEKEAAFRSGNNEFGQKLKGIIEDLHKEISHQSPDFEKTLKSLNKKYKQYSKYKELMPGKDPALKDILGATELGSALYYGKDRALPAIAGVTGIPIPFVLPGLTRQTVKALTQTPLPITSGSDRFKQGGLAHTYKKGGLSW
jgi:hypothetical protein